MKTYKSKLLGKKVDIKDKNSWANGEWGIITYYDGEQYHIALYGGDDCCLVFKRKNFTISRKS